MASRVLAIWCMDWPAVAAAGRVTAPLELPVHGQAATSAIAFSAPEHARQGIEGRWYLVRLRAEVTLARESRSGTVYVTASTNGRAAASAELRVRAGRHKRPRIAWNTLDLVRGVVLGDVDVRGQGRAAEGPQVDVDDHVLDPGCRGQGRRGGELDVVTLAVAERHGVDRIVIAASEGQAGGRIQPAREQDDGGRPRSGGPRNGGAIGDRHRAFEGSAALPPNARSIR